MVRTVHAGGRHVDPELAAEAIAAGDSPLTPREADVLELAASGAPIDEIADRAALSPGTVRNYLSNAMTKLDAANRHEAVADRPPHGLDQPVASTSSVLGRATPTSASTMLSTATPSTTAIADWYPLLTTA